MNTQVGYQSSQALSETRASFMRRVYTWMTGGILTTAMVSVGLAENPNLMQAIFEVPYLFTGLLIVQVVMVIALSAAINRISAAAATAIFLAYAALSGVTLSIIFVVYAHDTIAGVFFSTAFAFAGLSLMGYTTKRDLGPIGTFCGMALWGLVGWAILSWFFPSIMSGQGQFIYSIIGVVVFAGLTAYDTQKIKAMASATGEMEHKAAIYGALTLYLDFINLFLMLLRLAGGDRRR
jgi:uncharacterized protein